MVIDTDTPTIALSARQLHASLDDVEVLHGVNLSIEQGRWTSIVGPNGAGKSTLLRAVAGLIPSTGTIQLQGQDLRAMPPRLRARTLAWLGQSEGGGDDLTVADVAMLGRMPHQAWLSGPRPQDHQAVEDALRMTQAWEWRDRPLGQLSGGERQRVLLARALAVQAKVLLMDEPLANLDPPHQADWLDLVRELTRQGCTVVGVLHEISIALQADCMVILQKGNVVHQGPCADSATHRALETVFDARLAVHAVQGRWMALPRSAGSQSGA